MRFNNKQVVHFPIKINQEKKKSSFKLKKKKKNISI